MKALLTPPCKQKLKVILSGSNAEPHAKLTKIGLNNGRGGFMWIVVAVGIAMFIAASIGIAALFGAGSAEETAAPAAAVAPRPAKRVSRRSTPAVTEPLPAKIAFVDVETTGLGSSDRVVTFGGVLVDTASVAAGRLDLSTIHLIFNPERPCHPRASAVHGYTDAVLAAQEPFAMRAGQVETWLSAANLVVAHNAKFDLRFIQAELAAAGRRPVTARTFCTMEAFRASNPGRSAGLDAVLVLAGAARQQGRLHGALEDAWLAMHIFFWLRGLRIGATFADCPSPEIENWVEPPATPPKKRGRPRKSPTSTPISQ